MNRRKIDVVVSAIFVIASIIILTNDNLVQGGMETQLGSMFLPRIVAVFILIFAAQIGISALAKLRKGTPLGKTENINTEGFMGIGIYLMIFVLYWLLLPNVGFLILTPFAIFGIALLLGGRKWFAITAMSVFTPILIFYASNQFLRVFLPTWSLS